MSRFPSPAVAGAVRVVAVVASLALIVAACGAAMPSSAPPPSGAAAATAMPTSSPAGPTAVVIDTDLSFDDILAISYLLREPEVDVRAVTVTGTGLVHCLSGLQVMARLLATLERSNLPVSCGRDEPLAGGHAFPADWREGADGAYGLALELASVSDPDATAPELLAAVAGAAAEPITVVALGPLTNLADALAADAGLNARIGRIVAMGGAVDVSGNVATDPAGTGAPGPAEWNVYADPAAADAVFRSGIPITLVPLDATQAVPVDQAFVDALAADHTAAGADIAYELVARRGVNGLDYLWDALAAVVAVDASVVTIEPMKLAVVTTEGADSGRTIRADDGREIQVATTADRAAFEERFLAGLRVGAPRAHPFTLAGTIHATYDGTACVEDAPAAIPAGPWMVEASTTADGGTWIGIVRLVDGATWKQLIEYAATADPNKGAPMVDRADGTYLEGISAGRFLTALVPGTYGVVCLHGSTASAGVESAAPATEPIMVEAAP